MGRLLTCAVALGLWPTMLMAQGVIRVPVATAVPVLIDGEIETDEWADARAVASGDSLRLYVKHRDGHVFLAVRQDARTPRPVDVFIIPVDGRVHQVHASMATGERVLDIPWNDTVPAWRWNRHPDWTANDAEVDDALPETLSFSDRLIERDGVEFQLRDRGSAGSGGGFASKSRRSPGATACSCTLRNQIAMRPGHGRYSNSNPPPEGQMPLP